MTHERSFGSQPRASNQGSRGTPKGGKGVGNPTGKSTTKTRGSKGKKPPAAPKGPVLLPEGPPSDARDAVCRRLSLLAEDTKHPDLRPLDVSGLEPREAGLARAIYRSAVTRWPCLTHLIGRHLSRPWGELEAPLKGAMLAGGAQLLFLDGVMAHAAVNETVAWVKKVHPRASGLVNAVLRRLSEDVASTRTGPVVRDRWQYRRDELPLSRGGALVLSGDWLPSTPPERLEAATGIPRWQVARWIEAHGLDKAAAMCAHSLIEPPVVLHTAHAQPSFADPDNAAQHEEPGHHVLLESPLSLERYLADHPGVWVQDSSSSRAIANNADLEPKLIVDLCAGQGTKTRQLAATFPQAQIVATDIDQRRLRTLRSVFDGDERVKIVEAEEVVELCGRRADLVLADVPCSNSGVLARRAEARLRLGEGQLRRLVNDQRTVLDQAVTLLSRTGHILYATCSLDAAENRDQAEWATRTHGLRLLADRLTLPGGSPGGPMTQYCDGAYWALLTTTGPQTPPATKT